MLSSGFNINKCVYVEKKPNTIYVIVCLYIDNILILGGNTNIIKTTKKLLTDKFDMKNIDVIDVLGCNTNIIKTTKKLLTDKFDMKNIGVMDVILGIRIYKTHDALILS
jgi:hypothetical protein